MCRLMDHPPGIPQIASGSLLPYYEHLLNSPVGDVASPASGFHSLFSGRSKKSKIRGRAHCHGHAQAKIVVDPCESGTKRARISTVAKPDYHERSRIWLPGLNHGPGALSPIPFPQRPKGRSCMTCRICLSLSALRI